MVEPFVVVMSAAVPVVYTVRDILVQQMSICCHDDRVRVMCREVKTHNFCFHTAADVHVDVLSDTADKVASVCTAFQYHEHKR